MSFGGYGRTPDAVQRHNGRAYTFKTIAERYDNTPPLRGKRKAMDIRPHGERARCHERIVKVSDNEYYLTNNAYRWYDKRGYSPCRAITFKRNDDGTELVIVHTPRRYWGDKPEDREQLMPKQIGVPSSFYFYSYNLPEGMSMYKYHSKSYLQVKVEDGYSESAYRFYTLDMGDVHLTRQVGDKYFKPLIVHREVKRSLDRSKTKAVRSELKQFFEYVRVMTPLAEADRQQCWGDPIHYSKHASKEGLYSIGSLGEKCIGKGWRGLFTGEDNELWFNLVQYYKYKCQRTKWNDETRRYEALACDPKAVMRSVTNQVYQIEKPLIEEPVELGVKTFDKYRNW
jgi:hypothetical protein